MANATEVVPATATVQVALEQVATAHRCSWACRDEGLCPTELRIVLVTCACGREFTDAQWFVSKDRLCPECGTDLEAPVEAAFESWGRP